MLRRILQQRIGTHVPIHPQKVNNDCFLKSECKKVIVSMIKPNCTDEMSNIKEYMFKTFYKEAPIPIVLKLDRNCQETKRFLQKELDLFVNSGVSYKFCDSSSGDIVGIGFSCVWNRDPSYEIIG